MSRLRRVVVAEEDKAVSIGALQQDGARPWCVVSADRRKHHRVRLPKAGRYSVGQPAHKLSKGIGVDAIDVQPSQLVAAAERGERGGIHGVIVTTTGSDQVD